MAIQFSYLITLPDAKGIRHFTTACARCHADIEYRLVSLAEIGGAVACEKCDWKTQVATSELLSKMTREERRLYDQRMARRAVIEADRLREALEAIEAGKVYRLSVRDDPTKPAFECDGCSISWIELEKLTDPTDGYATYRPFADGEQRVVVQLNDRGRAELAKFRAPRA